ncbi:hypothetical protein E4T56_gene3264 [Termitomyces sp. T112]|nr:hypothetical protein E4T56_gene3264 [Termitomyces sp. T112]
MHPCPTQMSWPPYINPWALFLLSFGTSLHAEREEEVEDMEMREAPPAATVAEAVEQEEEEEMMEVEKNEGDKEQEEKVQWSIVWTNTPLCQEMSHSPFVLFSLLMVFLYCPLLSLFAGPSSSPQAALVLCP